MKIYLVGGAVRDQLLGLPIQERDWVVVGSTPDEMLAAGYRPVGKDFPVFLHPETHEEYALARTERKVAKGYKGFNFYTDPSITLEEDLKRRDLTINAMAQDAQGHLIDPYHGQADLREKKLRHVSLAFAEDPVRLLRVARFAARLPTFSVANETLDLMQALVNAGEIDALVAERVWQECAKALCATSPARFFEVLEATGARAILFPEIAPEGDGITALQRANKASAVVRFAVLLHPLTLSEGKALFKRFRVPRPFCAVAELVMQWHSAFAQFKNLTPEETLHILKRVDSTRRRTRFLDFLAACQICHPETPQAFNFFMAAADAIAAIDLSPLKAQNLEGKAFAEALQALQTKAIESLTK